MDSRTLAVLVLLLVSVFPAAGEEVAPSVRAEAPQYRVGDDWRYSNGVVLRVVAIEDGQVVTIAIPNKPCEGCRYYRDQNFTVTQIVDRNGKPVVDDAAVGFKTLDFPLYVGKRWTSNQELRPVNAPYLRVHYDNTFTVEGYEEVTTKAGTFWAFKIGWYQVSQGGRFSGTASLWYSPEVKAVVKREVHTANWLSDVELESYTLK